MLTLLTLVLVEWLGDMDVPWWVYLITLLIDCDATAESRKPKPGDE